MTYDHLQADCLYTGISSGPNARYRVWEAFTFTFFYPHFEEVRGGIEPWLMARRKARIELLLTVIELLFFYLLRLRRYKAKCVKTRCLQEGVRHLEPRFQGEGVFPLPIY